MCLKTLLYPMLGFNLSSPPFGCQVCFYTFASMPRRRGVVVFYRHIYIMIIRWPPSYAILIAVLCTTFIDIRKISDILPTFSVYYTTRLKKKLRITQNFKMYLIYIVHLGVSSNIIYNKNTRRCYKLLIRIISSSPFDKMRISFYILKVFRSQCTTV